MLGTKKELRIRVCGRNKRALILLLLLGGQLTAICGAPTKADNKDSLFSPLPKNLGSSSQQYGLAVQSWLIENVDAVYREMSKMSQDRLLSLDLVKSFEKRLWLTNSVEVVLEKTIVDTEMRLKALEDLIRKPGISSDLRKQSEENLKYAQALFAALKLNVDKVATLRGQIKELSKRCEDWQQVWDVTLPVVGLEEMRKQLRTQIATEQENFKEWAESEKGLDLRRLKGTIESSDKK